MHKLIHAVSFLVCGVLGFFCAGAIYFPIAEDYLPRVLLSLGGMAIAYGGESVIRFGHVRACTFSFSAPDCKEYSVLIPAIVLWACFFLLWLWLAPKRRKKMSPPGSD
jgi:ribose/xylose/arabinose/galactoside ABC-type transport system permease subunit